MNANVPKFVPKDLPGYERDELMTWYRQGTCEDFLRDTDKHFLQGKIINFDIIHRHRQCCGEEVPEDLLKYYQATKGKNVLQYPTPEQDKVLSSAFRTDRKDIFLKKKKKNYKKTLQ